MCTAGFCAISSTSFRSYCHGHDGRVFVPLSLPASGPSQHAVYIRLDVQAGKRVTSGAVPNFRTPPKRGAGGELHRGVLGWRRTWEQTTGRIVWSIVVLDAPDFTSLP